jgi:hypothetical protein
MLMRWGRLVRDLVVLAAVVALGVLNGCALDTGKGGAVALLRAQFPRHADRVLGSDSPRALAARPDGTFAPTPRADLDAKTAAAVALEIRDGLQASFPARGDGAVRMSLPDGFTIEIREAGRREAGRVEHGAVVYELAGGGASFWGVTEAGYEEWRLARPGPDGVVAEWMVAGGTLQRRGEGVEVVDAAGRVRLLVTAPAAHDRAGTWLKPRLEVAGGRLTLAVAPAAGARGDLVLVDPLWQPAQGVLATPRSLHTATLLANGTLLLAGGKDNSAAAVSGGEQFDPATSSWTNTSSGLATQRYGHTATLLPSGKVLVAGGYTGSNHLASAVLYDPATKTFAATGALMSARTNHTATLLANGKVLVVGGFSSAGGWLGSAELYDPGTGSFALTGSLATKRNYHTATLLPAGNVLVAGGSASSTIASAELYNPGLGSFALTGSLATARASHTATVLLPAGKVLLAGGCSSSGSCSTTPLASAELFDPGLGTFSATGGALTTARTGHSATLLPSGKVLLGGGQDGTSSYLAAAELFAPAAASGAGTFDGAGVSLATRRASHTATLLTSGAVAFVGGSNDISAALNSTEIYTPSTGTFTATSGTLGTARTRATVTLLPDGRVLVAGGCTGSPTCAALNTALLYDPAARTFATTGSMSATRMSHTATLLPSGKVLVAGGSTAVTTAELYDPGPGTFAATGPMSTVRWLHSATLLASGKVLVAGGSFEYSTARLATAELYDPDAGTFALTGPLATGRADHTATLLPELLPAGKVLVAGGNGSIGSLNGVSLSTVELYDPIAGTFAPTASLATARSGHSASRLQSGKVVITGGTGSGGALASTESYAAGVFTTVGPLATARSGHTATLLPSGRVLFAGGSDAGFAPVASAEVYDPATNSLAAAGPLVAARGSHAATLLHSGEVLVAGGCAGTTCTTPLNSAEVYDEGRGAASPRIPTLNALPTAQPGGTLALNGTLFTGSGAEGSSGSTRSSATNYPLVLLWRQDDQGLTIAPTRDWTATSVTADIPTTLLGGPHRAWVVVDGIISKAQWLTVATLPLGTSCGSYYQCASRRCVDGYCCDSDCTADCQRCNGADLPAPWSGAQNGQCTTAPAGYGGRAACANNLMCNGVSTACPSSCGDDSHCVGGRYCAPNGTCPLQVDAGATCNLSADCLVPGCRMCKSGHCVDGFCCDTACADPCWSCKLSTHQGTCWPSPPGDADDGACAVGTGICKQSCDGAGSCTAQGAAVLCAGSSATCSAGAIHQPDHCDGVGHCVSGAIQSCGGYQCAGDNLTCLADCLGHSDCVAGYYCQGGVCIGGKANGELCATHPECNSGSCADGVCCDRTCDGSCTYCNFDAQKGHCVAVPNGQDPRGECQASSGGTAECAGSCQTGQCAFPDVGKACGLCAACDGTGRCTAEPADDVDCGVIDCSGLDTVCRAYPDVTTSRCAAFGVCKTANDPATCTGYADRPCTDGGSPYPDGGDTPPGDGGTSGNKSGGCRAAAAGASAPIGLVTLLALRLFGWRRRR